MTTFHHLYKEFFLSNYSPFSRNNLTKFVVILFICVFGGLSIQSSAAQDNRWLYVATDKSGFDIYLDKTSVEQSDNGFFAWNKFLYSDGSYTITRSDWQCRRKQHRIIIANIYNPQGIFVKSLSGRVVWLDITPDSVAESLYKVICQSDSLEAVGAEKSSVRVVSKMANLRESPSTDAPVIGKVAAGKVFRLVAAETQNGWYQIYFGKNQIAWIHNSTVE